MFHNKFRYLFQPTDNFFSVCMSVRVGVWFYMYECVCVWVCVHWLVLVCWQPPTCQISGDFQLYSTAGMERVGRQDQPKNQPVHAWFANLKKKKAEIVEKTNKRLDRVSSAVIVSQCESSHEDHEKMIKGSFLQNNLPGFLVASFLTLTLQCIKRGEMVEHLLWVCDVCWWFLLSHLRMTVLFLW